MASFADYVDMAAPGFSDPASPGVGFQGDSGVDNIISTNSGQQITQSMLEKVSDVVYGLANGLITEAEARARMAAIGLTSASTQQFIDQGLQQKAAFAARGQQALAPQPGVGTATPQPSPTGVAAPTSVIQSGPRDVKETDVGKLLRQFYGLSLQEAPEQAFRQFFQARGAPGGGSLSSRALSFLGAPAEEGFFLSPFLHPGRFTGANPLETLGQFTMPQFLEGFGGGGGMGVPSPEGIRSGLRIAGGLFNQQGNPAQQAIADILNRPDANQSVFDMIANPIVGRSGRLFANAIQGYLNRAFSRFQEDDPSRSFLQEVLGGRAGSGFGGMTF